LTLRRDARIREYMDKPNESQMPAGMFYPIVLICAVIICFSLYKLGRYHERAELCATTQRP
jgi:hypothetical protein